MKPAIEAGVPIVPVFGAMGWEAELIHSTEARDADLKPFPAPLP